MLKIEKINVIVCKHCGNDEPSEYHRMGTQPVKRKGGITVRYQVFQCKKCDRLFSFPIEAIEHLDYKKQDPSHVHKETKEEKEPLNVKILRSKITQLETALDKANAFQEIIIEAVKDEVKALPPIKPPVIEIKGKYCEEYAVLDFSDVQIGSLVTSKEVSGLAQYGKDDMRKRIKELTKSIYSIVNIQRVGGVPLKKLKIHVLGDIVQGENVYHGQGFKLDALLLEQVFELGAELIELLFMPMAELFEDVEIFCIPGNHGSQGKQGDVSRNTNWDYVTYIFWKTLMQEIKHVKFHISAAPFLLYEMFPDQIHCLIHGQQARGWMGMPYYGIDRMHRRLMALTGVYISFLHHGHHHQPSIQDTHIGKKIGNGSIEGGSDYSVNDLLTANTPQQFFFGINEKGMTWEYWIKLEDYRRLHPGDSGILTTLMFEGDKNE